MACHAGVAPWPGRFTSQRSVALLTSSKSWKAELRIKQISARLSQCSNPERLGPETSAPRWPPCSSPGGDTCREPSAPVHAECSSWEAGQRPDIYTTLQLEMGGLQKMEETGIPTSCCSCPGAARSSPWAVTPGHVSRGITCQLSHGSDPAPAR